MNMRKELTEKKRVEYIRSSLLIMTLHVPLDASTHNLSLVAWPLLLVACIYFQLHDLYFQMRGLYFQLHATVHLLRPHDPIIHKDWLVCNPYVRPIQPVRRNRTCTRSCAHTVVDLAATQNCLSNSSTQFKSNHLDHSAQTYEDPFSHTWEKRQKGQENQRYTQNEALSTNGTVASVTAPKERTHL